MGQLFDRISRMVRAEQNLNKTDYQETHLNEGFALVAGGAGVGASIGKVGILAGGTGYSLGSVPLAATGALTGAALYEALRSILEGDTSSASAAVIGGAVGAATSATIGGVGVAVGGSAIGVGMASMAAGGAVVGLGLVGLNRLIQHGVDPEKLLDSAINQMETDLQNARQAMINLMASQKRLQQQHEKAQAEANKWEQRARLALERGNEYLAREALTRKKMHAETLNSLNVQLDQDPASAKNLKQNLTLLEAKICEAKTMRISLKAQIAAAKASGQLQSTGNLSTSSAMAAFERMEDKVLQLEARSQAAAELAGAELEAQFRSLESGDMDLELEAMKQQMLESSQSAQSQSSNSNSPCNYGTIDAELDELKRMLDQL